MVVKRKVVVLIGILGAAYTMGQKLHLSITILPEKLNERNKIRIEMLINVIILIFSVSVLVVGGMRLVYITLTLGQTSSALLIPLWIIYSVLPFSGLLTCYYCISNILILQTQTGRDGKH